MSKPFRTTLALAVLAATSIEIDEKPNEKGWTLAPDKTKIGSKVFEAGLSIDVDYLGKSTVQDTQGRSVDLTFMVKDGKALRPIQKKRDVL